LQLRDHGFDFIGLEDRLGAVRGKRGKHFSSSNSRPLISVLI
jgi:hypothetical protein